MRRQEPNQSPVGFPATRGRGLLLALLLSGCGGTSGAVGPTGLSGNARGLMLQEQQVEDRPQVVAIVRSGDPRPGLSLVLGTEASAADAVAMGALLAARIQRQVPGFEVHLGLDVVSITGTLEGPARAADAVLGLDWALRTEVTDAELRGPEYVAQLRRLEQLVRAREAEIERRVCLGEAGVLLGGELTVDSSLGNRLEQQRKRLFSQAVARFGAVGDEPTVAAVVEGVRRLPAWPAGEPPAERVAKADFATFHQGEANALALVLRTGKAERVFALKRALSVDLRAAEPRPRVLRASALPHGGCLRVELEPGREDDAPLELLAMARRIVAEARDGAVGGGAARQFMVLSALEEPAPTRAAELAALVSLSRDSSAAKDGLGLALTAKTPLPESLRSETVLLSRVLLPPSAVAHIGIVERVEEGQGKLYALLASPCVPRLEGPRTVGSAALFLSASAERYSGTEGVAIEAWITPEGAGLIGSTGRRSESEAPAEQAERLGRVLGMAVSTMPDNDAFWRARTALLAHMGPGPRPALWQALTALAPDAPGLTAPHGTFATVEALKPGELRERLRQWQGHELRLAFLSNARSLDAKPLEAALSHWLAPYRLDAATCALPPPAPMVSTDEQITAARGSGDATATVAVRLPTTAPLDATYADWLERALSAPGGWLEQLARKSERAVRYEATLVGGRLRQGLVVAVGAPTAETDAAVTAIKGLIAELGKGSLPFPLDVTEITRGHREQELLRLSEPRQRLVELWLGREKQPEPTEADFRGYLRRAFTEGEVAIVRAPVEPEKPAAPVLRKAPASPPRASKSGAKPRSASRP